MTLIQEPAGQPKNRLASRVAHARTGGKTKNWQQNRQRNQGLAAQAEKKPAAKPQNWQPNAQKPAKKRLTKFWIFSWSSRKAKLSRFFVFLFFVCALPFFQNLWFSSDLLRNQSQLLLSSPLSVGPLGPNLGPNLGRLLVAFLANVSHFCYFGTFLRTFRTT